MKLSLHPMIGFQSLHPVISSSHFIESNHLTQMFTSSKISHCEHIPYTTTANYGQNFRIETFNHNDRLDSNHWNLFLIADYEIMKFIWTDHWLKKSITIDWFNSGFALDVNRQLQDTLLGTFSGELLYKLIWLYHMFTLRTKLWLTRNWMPRVPILDHLN